MVHAASWRWWRAVDRVLGFWGVRVYLLATRDVPELDVHSIEGSISLLRCLLLPAVQGLLLLISHRVWVNPNYKSCGCRLGCTSASTCSSRWADGARARVPPSHCRNSYFTQCTDLWPSSGLASHRVHSPACWHGLLRAAAGSYPHPCQVRTHCTLLSRCGTLCHSHHLHPASPARSPSDSSPGPLHAQAVKLPSPPTSIRVAAKYVLGAGALGGLLLASNTLSTRENMQLAYLIPTRLARDIWAAASITAGK